jgi:hypothetical protein
MTKEQAVAIALTWVHENSEEIRNAFAAIRPMRFPCPDWAIYGVKD